MIKDILTNLINSFDDNTHWQTIPSSETEKKFISPEAKSAHQITYVNRRTDIFFS